MQPRELNRGIIEDERAYDPERGVWFTHDDDAMATLFARLPASDALLLERELTIAAKGVRADPQLIRELATRPGTLFSRILTDPAGGVIDVTELGRFPTATLERALVLLDGICAFPTCNTAAVSCDTDHEQPHPRGPTTATNLWHLCRRHHRFKTRGRLTTTIGTDGRHRWMLPTSMATSRTHLRRTFTATSRLEAHLTGLINMEYPPAA